MCVSPHRVYMITRCPPLSRRHRVADVAPHRTPTFHRVAARLYLVEIYSQRFQLKSIGVLYFVFIIINIYGYCRPLVTTHLSDNIRVTVHVDIVSR